MTDHAAEIVRLRRLAAYWTRLGILTHAHKLRKRAAELERVRDSTAAPLPATGAGGTVSKSPKRATKTKARK